jgi:hypothetical protein
MSDRPIQACKRQLFRTTTTLYFTDTDGAVRHAACQKAGFPPFTGAAIGVVVGGVLVIVSQYCYEKYYSNAEQYLCLDCQQAFAWVP